MGGGGIPGKKMATYASSVRYPWYEVPNSSSSHTRTLSSARSPRRPCRYECPPTCILCPTYTILYNCIISTVPCLIDIVSYILRHIYIYSVMCYIVYVICEILHILYILCCTLYCILCIVFCLLEIYIHKRSIAWRYDCPPVVSRYFWRHSVP